MKKTKKTKNSYWVVMGPGFEAAIVKKPVAWRPGPADKFFRGPFWRAKYARQYGRTMAYGEVAKARNKAFWFKKGDLE